MASSTRTTKATSRKSTTERQPKSKETVEIAHRTLPVSLPTLDAFYRWMAERDQIRRKRSAGTAPPWSKDPTLNSHKFCHVFRIFDRGTQFLLHNVINKGSQEHRNICFRVILFKLFNRASTWIALERELGPLTWSGFDIHAYEQVLARLVRKNPIYTSAYQIPPPKIVDGPGFKNHLLVLQMMMEDDLPQKLLSCTNLKGAYELIKLYPGMGQFLSYQLVLDLNMTPELNYSENEWAICGPGSQNCLEKIFGPEVRGIEAEAIEHLYRSQSEHFTRLRIIDPPQLSASCPGVSFVDIEHSLCECSKYLSRQGREGTWQASEEHITSDLPTKWAQISSDSLREQYPKEIPPLVTTGSCSGSDDDDDVYEVSHIVRERQLGSGKVKYRIRWTGYAPDEDTWMSEAELENAPEALKEWRSQRLLESEINRRISDMRANNPRRKTRNVSENGTGRSGK